MVPVPWVKSMEQLNELVAAIVDRLTFHAYIIKTGTQSYRLRTTPATGAEANGVTRWGIPLGTLHGVQIAPS